MDAKVIIDRYYKDKQTEGRAYVFGTRGEVLFDCHSLELPDLNNQRSISCIPEGEYTCIKHYSPTFGLCFWIQDVPGRSEILIHVANYVGSPNPKTGMPDLRGCIGVGMELRDFTGDKVPELIKSKVAMNHLIEHLPNEFKIIIRKRGDYRTKVVS